MTEVLIQYFSLKDKSLQLEEILKNLPLTIQNRVSEYGKEEDKVRSAVGYFLLKNLLSTIGKDIQTISFQDKGKPVFGDGINGSISHSGDYVVAAFSSENIGIDIEKHRIGAVKLSDKYFTKEELKILGEDSQLSFFKGWVIKEAATKFHGQGIGILSQIKIVDNSIVSLMEENLQYQLLDIDKEYSLGLVSKKLVKTTISQSLLQSCQDSV